MTTEYFLTVDCPMIESILSMICFIAEFEVEYKEESIVRELLQSTLETYETELVAL